MEWTTTHENCCGWPSAVPKHKRTSRLRESGSLTSGAETYDHPKDDGIRYTLLRAIEDLQALAPLLNESCMKVHGL